MTRPEDELAPIVYDELRRLARAYLRGERAGHTLQPTALVHEAYLKLAGGPEAPLDRARFLGAAAQAMRRILVDHARGKNAEKRGGGARRVPPSELSEVAAELAWFEERDIDLERLDRALDRLAAADAAKARLVELRFFAGLEMQDAAEVLGLSLRSAERQWTLAKARLRAEMERDE